MPSGAVKPHAGSGYVPPLIQVTASMPPVPPPGTKETVKARSHTALTFTSAGGMMKVFPVTSTSSLVSLLFTLQLTKP